MSEASNPTPAIYWLPGEKGLEAPADVGAGKHRRQLLKSLSRLAGGGPMLDHRASATLSPEEQGPKRKLGDE